MKKSTLFFLMLVITYVFYGLGLLFPQWLTTYYTQTINKLYIQFLSLCTGVLPFSLFEICVYLLVMVVLGYILYRFIHLFTGANSWKKQLQATLIHMFYLVFSLLMIFLWSWGFNYHRLPLAKTIGLSTSTYTTEDLGKLYMCLIDSANTLRESVEEDAAGYMAISGGYRDVFRRSQVAYTTLAKKYPFFSGHYGPPKAIMASSWMNYTGITGIYSPFTAEANVNVAILDQALPYTTLHEMAHQRGFASEDECNFIAFLACSLHPDKDFQYSGYLLALAYTNATLSKSDPVLLSTLNQKISPKVRADLLHSNTFWRNYEGPLEEMSSKVNDTYLKANGIPEGEQSYGEMVDLLLSYYTQYPNAFLLH